MIRKLLGVPLKIVKRALNREEPPKPAAPVKRSPPPRPAAPVARDHDHGHDHGGGHDHGHSHDHGGAREPEPEPQDHGHSHDHGAAHDHGHSHDHGGGRPAAKAAPAADVGLNIQITESDTPNPNAHKFTASVTVIEKGSLSFNAADEAASHPVSRHIWALGGVKGIFAVKDFVTVTKTPEASWSDLSPRIPGALRRGLVERDGA